ncbi:MAG: hypothetical protein PVH88_13955 [Ignavibacteria bacterium]|jgi:hypothetical protein
MEDHQALSDSAKKMGSGSEFHLLTKTARIKNGIGRTPEDILGWDFQVRDDNGVCYEYYAAQHPLIGMTQPQPIPCPLGIRVINNYEVKFQQAIEKMNQINCGDAFVEMSLYWPLTPACKEPEWHIRTNLGSEIVILADSGAEHCLSY